MTIGPVKYKEEALANSKHVVVVDFSHAMFPSEKAVSVGAKKLSSKATSWEVDDGNGPSWEVTGTFSSRADAEAFLKKYDPEIDPEEYDDYFID